MESVAKTVPPSRTVPYEIVLRSDTDLRPGETRLIASDPLEVLFRADSAERIKGIDYESFEACAAFVGQTLQFNESRPVAEMFVGLRRRAESNQPSTHPNYGDPYAPFNTCLVALSIGIQIRNGGDRPLPFAIRLAGLALP